MSQEYLSLLHCFTSLFMGKRCKMYTRRALNELPGHATTRGPQDEHQIQARVESGLGFLWRFSAKDLPRRFSRGMNVAPPPFSDLGGPV